MARVLFFLQLIFVAVLYPVFADPALLGPSLLYLVLILVVSLGASTAAQGVRASFQALSDAFSHRRLGLSGPRSLEVWRQLQGIFPLAGVMSGIVVLIPLLASPPSTPGLPFGLVLALDALLWGLLGWTAARVLGTVVDHLSQAVEARPHTGIPQSFQTRYGLTAREAEVATLILEGLSYKDAAARLYISPATLKTHLLRVYEKTRSSSKIELLRLVEDSTINQTVDGRPSPREAE